MDCNHNQSGPARPGFAYNPFEIAFFGHAGSSRSTLVSRLIRDAFTDYTVGHVDNDVPKEGQSQEETIVYYERARDQHVVVYPPRKQEYTRPWPLLDADMVFVEEGRECDLPKIVVLDDLRVGKLSRVIAYVGRGASCVGQAAGSPPFLQRDDLDAIRAVILDHFMERLKARPLYGLILAGGQSKRMNRDKAGIPYHGRPQVRHCWELLDPLCRNVFVSCREDQAETDVFRGLPQIHDTFLDAGPAGGILSAMRAHPDAAWLVLACDLPFMDGPTLERLVQRRNPFKLATAYVAPHGGLPEPLCAIYEPKSIFRLLHFLAQGLACPRKVLVNSDTELVEAENPDALTNVNNPREYELAMNTLLEQRRSLP